MDNFTPSVPRYAGNLPTAGPSDKYEVEASNDRVINPSTRELNDISDELFAHINANQDHPEIESMLDDEMSPSSEVISCTECVLNNIANTLTLFVIWG